MVHFQIRDLNFSYPGENENPVLQHIDLDVQAGEYMVICGQSGSGKTTLLKHLKTALTPHGQRSGQILLEGKPLEELSKGAQSALIGYVMQDPDDQIVTDKVWHELAFGLENLGKDPNTIRLRVAEMASYFGIQDWFHRNVAELSGGQKQLLNLASIMAMQPKVLILDEPTSQLDPIAAADFLSTVRRINTELGTTVIITEHRLEDILPYADRVVVMDSGRIIANDRPREVCRTLHQAGHPMFTAMPTPAQVFYRTESVGSCPLTVREGRKWLENACPSPAVSQLPTQSLRENGGQATVELQDVWFRYEKNTPDILRGLNAKIPKGSLFAIVGGNGAGKSTALKAICNICKPYRGKVLIDGKNVSKYRADQLFRGKLAMLPQDPKSLFVKDSVREELEEMCRDEAAIAQVAQTCRITHLLGRHPYDLSGGEQQRAALAKVLLTQPTILLLDEPTKGIDCFFKDIFASILAQLKQSGITIIMVSHDVEFCARHADLVSMFFDGQIMTTATPRRFFGSNSFYTTSANRMSRCVFQNAISWEDVAQLYMQNH